MISYSRLATVSRLSPSYLVFGRRAVHDRSDKLPTPPPIAALEDAKQNAQAREWIQRFKVSQIPRDLVELTFSRSSGPGGQNVNKVNTKASLRCSLASPWIPLWARDHLKKSPFYVSSSQTLLVTSTLTRSQAHNIQDCLTKLHAMVISAASAPLVNEPSQEDLARLKKLEGIAKARRRMDKDRRSDLKRSRSSQDWL